MLVAHLENGNTFVQMLKAMVETDAANYDSLIGLTFEDRFVPSNFAPSSRRT